jgi:hypothetical protein|nr:MAG TPA: hypothetical protein [Caudoviricetes sp.]
MDARKEFELELKARGLQLTKSEVNKLMELAVRQRSYERATPVLKKEKHFHYFVLVMAYISAIDKLAEYLKDSELVKFLMKNRLNKAKNLANELKEEFKKVYLNNSQLVTAFEQYVTDFEDIIFVHLCTINNEMRGEKTVYDTDNNVYKSGKE